MRILLLFTTILFIGCSNNSLQKKSDIMLIAPKENNKNNSSNLKFEGEEYFTDEEYTID